MEYAGAVGTSGFTNPAGAVGSEEAQCAEIYGCCGDVNWIGFWNDFGFAIPACATIQGIQVDLMQAWQQDPPTPNSLGVTIGKDETTLGTEKTGGPQTEVSEGWCGTMPIETYGGPTDLWGLTWTPADINSSNFTVRFRNVDDEEFGITLNWIRVTVTTAEGGDLTIIDWREVY